MNYKVIIRDREQSDALANELIFYFESVDNAIDFIDLSINASNYFISLIPISEKTGE